MTEAVTGLDLVRLQLLIAGGIPAARRGARRAGRRTAGPRHRGPPLRRGPGPRLAALDRDGSTGSSLGSTGHSGVRVDSGVESGSVVSPHYDPMLAKVIAHAPTRAEAAAALAAALARARIHGVTTNRDLLVRTLRHPGFVAGQTDTGFLDRHGLDGPGRPAGRRRPRSRRHAVAAALAGQAAPPGRGRRCRPTIPSGFRNNAFGPPAGRLRRQRRRVVIAVGLPVRPLRPARAGRGRRWTARRARSTRPPASADGVVLTTDGVTRRYLVDQVGPVAYVDGPDGSSALVEAGPLPDGRRPGQRQARRWPRCPGAWCGWRWPRATWSGRPGAGGARGHEDGARRARHLGRHGGRGRRGRGRPGGDGSGPGGRRTPPADDGGPRSRRGRRTDWPTGP